MKDFSELLKGVKNICPELSRQERAEVFMAMISLKLFGNLEMEEEK